MTTENVRLSDVAEFDPPTPRNGKLGAATTADFLPMAAVDSDSLIVRPTEQRPIETLVSGFTYFSDGDILVAKITPCFENGKIAEVQLSSEHGFGSTEFHVLRAKAGHLHPRYLTHFLRQPSVRHAGERRMTGSAGQRRVPRDFLKELAIPLPPLEEQRRIAAIMDKADALRQKRRAALQKLDYLTQSLFLDMFGDPVANTKGWPKSPLGELLELHQYGPRFYDEPYTESGVRIVRITDLDSRGNLDFSKMPRLEVSRSDQEKYVLKAGEVIFARSGATVGKLSVVRSGDPPCIAGAYFIRLGFRDGAIHPSYARYVLASASMQAIIAKQSRQAAQQNFSGPALRRLSIPIPPFSRQRDFDATLSRLDSAETTLNGSRSKVDTLFESLQHRAFRGEL